MFQLLNHALNRKYVFIEIIVDKPVTVNCFKVSGATSVYLCFKVFTSVHQRDQAYDAISFY